jgi:hypothetical protein
VIWETVWGGRHGPVVPVRGAIARIRPDSPDLQFDWSAEDHRGYPDGAHDARALNVTSDGTVLILTSGFDGKSRLYSVSPDAWFRGSTRIDAHSAGTVAVDIHRHGLLTESLDRHRRLPARQANRLTF